MFYVKKSSFSKSTTVGDQTVKVYLNGKSKNSVTLRVTSKTAPEKIQLRYYGKEIMQLIAKDILRQEEEKGVKTPNAKVVKAVYASFEIFSGRQKKKPLGLKRCEDVFGEIMEKAKQNGDFICHKSDFFCIQNFDLPSPPDDAEESISR